MASEEITFLASLDAYEKKGSTAPPFTLAVGEDEVRIAFNNRLQNVTRYRDWVIVVMSMPGFRQMVKSVVNAVAKREDTAE